MSKRSRWIFPEAFKREAVKRAAKSGKPIVRVAERLGLHETVLRRWVGQRFMATWPNQPSSLI